MLTTEQLKKQVAKIDEFLQKQLPRYPVSFKNSFYWLYRSGKLEPVKDLEAGSVFFKIG